MLASSSALSLLAICALHEASHEGWWDGVPLLLRFHTAGHTAGSQLLDQGFASSNRTFVLPRVVAHPSGEVCIVPDASWLLVVKTIHAVTNVRVMVVGHIVLHASCLRIFDKVLAGVEVVDDLQGLAQDDDADFQFVLLHELAGVHLAGVPLDDSTKVETKHV